MTVALALGAAWAGLVFAGTARWRPGPRRLRDASRPQGPARRLARPGPERTSRTPRPRHPVLRRLVGERDPAAVRSWRRAGLVGVGLLAMVPPLAPVPLVAAWARPRLRRHRELRGRQQRLEASLPECVDLLALAVGAGCNVSMAVAAVGRRGSGPAAEALSRVVQETARGRRLGDCLDELARRDGEALRPLAAALAGCERYGSPVVASLERLSDEVRRQRQRRAEEAARKVPVLLVFPLVVCILPAFALLTVAPLIASALRELRL